MPGEENGYTEFWFNKGNNSFADQCGNGSEVLGEDWKRFTGEMKTLGVTGIYINDYD